MITTSSAVSANARSAAFLGLALLASTPARAESWCAMPLDVHEWGVHIVGTPDSVGSVELPPWFYTPAHEPVDGRPIPVRDLPADSGIRALPILHFYAKGVFGEAIPVGLEVGFKGGSASAWYPAVDRRRPAAVANSAAALLERTVLLGGRAARKSAPFEPHGPATSDPTRQLVWDRLDLTAAPPDGTPRATDVAWVDAARKIEAALWVRGRSETERFVFYEATTREEASVRLRRGPSHGPGHRQYLVENTSAYPVHDVFVVHREGGQAYVFEAPLVPPGKSVAFVLEDQVTNSFDKMTFERLRTLLVDAQTPAPADYVWGAGDCVMMRDPAIPVETADGHRLFAAEVDLLLATWKTKFFGNPGTTILYREDPALLDEVMPVSIYTDMYHFVRLRRASLALWPGVVLP